MGPQVTETRHVEITHLVLRQANNEGDLILHGNGKAMA